MSELFRPPPVACSKGEEKYETGNENESQSQSGTTGQEAKETIGTVLWDRGAAIRRQKAKQSVCLLVSLASHFRPVCKMNAVELFRMNMFAEYVSSLVESDAERERG